MLQRDYLVAQFQQFAEAIRLSIMKARGENPDPLAAADQLELALGSATSIDGATLLLLSPDTIAGILQVTDTDPDVVEYLVRTLLLESEYLEEAGDASRSQLRHEQAKAIAQAYGIALSGVRFSEEEFEEFYQRSINRGK